MRFIQEDKHNPKILEVVWMWLPTFIGQNTALLGELDHALAAKFPPPFDVTEDKLDEIHEFVVDYICGKHPIFTGLREYLQAVRGVTTK